MVKLKTSTFVLLLAALIVVSAVNIYQNSVIQQQRKHIKYCIQVLLGQ